MFIFLLVIINLPTFKADKIKYISVEIFDTKTEELITDTVEKPVSPEIEPIKQDISPPVPINKPTPIKNNIPEAPENKPISILAQFYCVEYLDYLYHQSVPDLVISPTLFEKYHFLS